MQQGIDFMGDDPREIQIAMSVKAELENAYPGYPWHVEVDVKQGICVVRLEFNGKYGFRMFLDSAATQSEFSKNVIWAGGELLERNNLPRDCTAAHAAALSDSLADTVLPDRS